MLSETVEQNKVVFGGQMADYGNVGFVNFSDSDSKSGLLISLNGVGVELDFSTKNWQSPETLTDFERVSNRISFVLLFDSFLDWWNELEDWKPETVEIFDTNRYFLIFLNNLFASVALGENVKIFTFTSNNSGSIDMRVLVSELERMKAKREPVEYDKLPMYLKLLADSKKSRLNSSPEC
ncbi:hypothetical protein M0R04_00045 [Candidatus Dojkabacteria bacterium]|jgi:hypothetical protein|nr:hypothetical protein [Candidatus Dojkabacteria bacterium]